MKKIVFNSEELKDSKVNFNVFCLMQLSSKEDEGKIELRTADIKVFIYGMKLGLNDVYNILDECGYIKEKSTTLRREYISENGVSAIYTYLAFSFECRRIIEISEEKLLEIIGMNNSKLTKLYIYLNSETLGEAKIITQKQLLSNIGLSLRSEGTLKKMTDLLVKMGLLKIRRFKDEKGINRIEYKAQ